MSAAEIADNKWELSATKAPVTTAAGLAQVLIMTGFALFFGWIIVSSVIGIVTPKNEDGGIAGDFKNLSVEGNKAPAPAE